MDPNKKVAIRIRNYKEDYFKYGFLATSLVNESCLSDYNYLIY